MLGQEGRQRHFHKPISADQKLNTCLDCLHMNQAYSWDNMAAHTEEHTGVMSLYQAHSRHRHTHVRILLHFRCLEPFE